MSSSSRVRLAYAKEDDFGVAPTTPVLLAVPFNEGDAFTNPRDVLVSQEVQSVRGPRSTRLGVNQPAKSLAFELQWRNHDDLLAGAFGDTWSGGMDDVTDTVTVAATTIELDAGTWAALGIYAGDYILYDDDGTLTILYILTISAVDTILNVKEVDQSTAPTLTVVSSGAKTLIVGGTGARYSVSVTDTMIFDATALTVTLAAGHANTWYDNKFYPGHNIYFFGTVSNDGWHKIASISANGLVLTLAAAPANETLNSTLDVDVLTDAGVIENGNTLQSFSFEEQFLDHNSDVGNYRTISGVKCGQLQMSLQPSAMVQMVIELIGAVIGDFGNSSFGASTTAYTEREAFDSFTGSIEVDDASADMSGLEFTLNNQENRAFNLFERNAGRITDGTPQMTGSINAYFDDETFSTKYLAETTFGLMVQMEDLDDHGYVLVTPTNKFTNDTISIGTTDVTEALPYTVEPVSGASEAQLWRQPEAR